MVWWKDSWKWKRMRYSVSSWLACDQPDRKIEGWEHLTKLIKVSDQGSFLPKLPRDSFWRIFESRAILLKDKTWQWAFTHRAYVHTKLILAKLQCSRFKPICETNIFVKQQDFPPFFFVKFIISNVTFGSDKSWQQVSSKSTCCTNIKDPACKLAQFAAPPGFNSAIDWCRLVTGTQLQRGI